MEEERSSELFKSAWWDTLLDHDQIIVMRAYRYKHKKSNKTVFSKNENEHDGV